VINKVIFTLYGDSSYTISVAVPSQIDIAQYVNASLEIMDRDSKLMRGDGPTIFCSVKEGKGIDDVANLILAAWRAAGSPGKRGAVRDVE